MSVSTNRRRGRTLILALLAASGFVVLADAAREHNGATAVDPHITNQIVHHRDSIATPVAHVLTFAGSEIVVAAVMLLILGLFTVRRQFASSAVIAIGMAGSALMTVGLKLAVERVRPPSVDRLGPVDHSYSFPSG